MTTKATSTSPPPGNKGKGADNELVKYLISCIRWSVNGKIDFAEVAKECNIVTKAAAAKRWERLMKAHGVTSKPASATADASVASPKGKKAAVANSSKKGTATTKKRKATNEEEVDENEDEEPAPLAKKAKVKKEAKTEVKEEETTGSESAAGVPQYDGGSDQPVVHVKAGTEKSSLWFVKIDKTTNQSSQYGDLDQGIVMVD